jgi:putative PIN family toxin of toxin-antitoxin system
VRAVVDTNVLVSGLLWQGPSHALIEHVRDGALSLVSSPALLAELADVLERSKFDDVLRRSNTSRERALADAQALAEVIAPAPLPRPVCRDPDDDEVLAVALSARVDLIISGDTDLLELLAYEGIPIVTPAQALSRIKAQS